MQHQGGCRLIEQHWTSLYRIFACCTSPGFRRSPRIVRSLLPLLRTILDPPRQRPRDLPVVVAGEFHRARRRADEAPSVLLRGGGGAAGACRRALVKEVLRPASARAPGVDCNRVVDPQHDGDEADQVAWRYDGAAISTSCDRSPAVRSQRPRFRRTGTSHSTPQRLRSLNVRICTYCVTGDTGHGLLPHDSRRNAPVMSLFRRVRDTQPGGPSA
jgi:hypothetical protein